MPDYNQEIVTYASDGLELLAGIARAARIDANGVTCLEAHLEGWQL